MNKNPHLLACATQGNGGDDEARLRSLLSGLTHTIATFSKYHKLVGAQTLLSQLRSRRFDLFVLEGTGFAGGLAAIAARLLWRMPYVVSSGDAAAPYLSARHPLGSPLFHLYERLLCSNASGFIGWTPYLVGRALTFGTPRGITIPGWAPFERSPRQLAEARKVIRLKLGIADETVVFGVVGSLTWSERYNYCYGAELVRAIKRSEGRAVVVVVGDGSGKDKLHELAGDALGHTVYLPGRVARTEVPDWLAAMDVGCIPQSVDQVGSFRYTTKLSEYMAVGLPFISNQIPMSYDLPQHNLWRLPGHSPWDPVFITSLVQLMDELTISGLGTRRASTSPNGWFDRDDQIERARAFLVDIMEAELYKK